MRLPCWGGLEMLINPFTYQKQGQIEITINRLGGMACRNDAAFARTKNLVSAGS